MYITHPTHGAGTRPSRTQPPTATRKTTQNAGQRVRQPGEGRGRNGQTHPRKKKNRGGGGGGERTARSHESARQHHKGRPNPPSGEAPKTRPPKGHRGTTQPKQATPSQEQRPTGRRDTQNAQPHTTLGRKKKEPATQPEREGMGGQGPQGPGQQQPATNTTKPSQDTKKNTPRQPNQEERGTAETRAQHARPHSTPQPAKAGNKQGARTNTHPCTAPRTRRCRKPRGTGARAHTHPNTPPRSGGAQPKTRPQRARPNRTPEPETVGCRRSARATTRVPYPQPRQVGCRPKPKPNHERHKPQPAKEGRHHKPYPNTPAQDPSQDWRGYRNPHPTATRTQTQAPHNGRTPSV